MSYKQLCKLTSRFAEFMVVGGSGGYDLGATVSPGRPALSDIWDFTVLRSTWFPTTPPPGEVSNQTRLKG